jgi:hypothetical protein
MSRPILTWALLWMLIVSAVGCTPSERLTGGTVIWQSTDGQERVVQIGPCVKTQRADSYSNAGWDTTYTQCAVPSAAP